MIQGVITTKDVLLHGRLIASEFGFAAWLRCCLALVSGGHTTFLEVVFGGGL
jgi:hypothetical protein